MMQRRTKQTIAMTLAVGALAALPAGASAKTWKASTVDPTGDGPVPGRDITEVKFRYKSNGSVLFVVTTAGPIDGANADAAVGVSLGSSCRKPLLSGGGVFSQPDPTVFFTIKGKKLGKNRKGEGEITNNVYTLQSKQSAFKNWKPGCFAVVLLDPATADSASPTVFDETDEIKIKR
jgi:hypothetical protein